jgi:putative tricarboxylic transport membrane protein
MTEQNMPKADFYTAVVLIAFGIAVMVISIKMPQMADQHRNVYSAPGIVPGLIGAVITMLSSVMLIRSIFKGSLKTKITGDAVSGFFKNEMTIRMVKTITLCVLYAVLLGKLPFAILTALFVFSFVLVFEYTRKETFRSQIRKIVFAFVLAS